MDDQITGSSPNPSLPPRITSFVIRFVSMEAASFPAENAEKHASTESDGMAESSPPYRGTIRHVQSDQELVFNRWDDAVKFIQHFISL